MQLVPYLTAAFQRYAEDGTPPFRALVLDTPNDKRLFGVDDQYMIGDRMMVAPIFVEEPGTSPQGQPRRDSAGARRIVLPEGTWHDFWTGEVLKGGTELSVSNSTEKIPVYVKSGSIVPWADVGLYAGAPETRRITARVYGDGSIPFTMTHHNETIRLSWSNGQGNVSGTLDFNVYAWKQIG
jgi:alpha-D-xyloside xylohydrolase